MEKKCEIISVPVESGKIKWLPTLMQETQEKYERDGFVLVDEPRTIIHYPGYRYIVTLHFRKETD